MGCISECISEVPFVGASNILRDAPLGGLLGASWSYLAATLGQVGPSEMHFYGARETLMIS